MKKFPNITQLEDDTLEKLSKAIDNSDENEKTEARVRLAELKEAGKDDSLNLSKVMVRELTEMNVTGDYLLKNIRILKWISIGILIILTFLLFRQMIQNLFL